MATSVRRLTYDDLEKIPEERPGDRHELIDGELVVTPSPTPVHQVVSRSIFRRLDHHVESNHLGTVLYAPVDVRLTPDNVLIPDILFVSRDRAHIVGDKAIDAPPDLVVEILSPGTRQRDLDVKRELYARFGVQEYWIVDPEAKTIVVLVLVGKQFEPLEAGEEGVIPSRILPQLMLTTEQVFEGTRQAEQGSQSQ
jgi:Uma2 family endonuclease